MLRNADTRTAQLYSLLGMTAQDHIWSAATDLRTPVFPDFSPSKPPLLKHKPPRAGLDNHKYNPLAGVTKKDQESEC